MTSGLCFGNKCKLRWGYNKSLDRLIPVERSPCLIKSKICDEWGYAAISASSTNPAPNILLYDGFISHFLEPNWRKFLDFGQIYDDDKYWLVCCWLYTRIEECERLPQYPSNCSHFVAKIMYGVNIFTRFPKRGFPEDKAKVRFINIHITKKINDLFEERNFNEDQRKVLCKVWINFNEIEEMTLGELGERMENLHKEKDSKYDIPIYFTSEELIRNFRETVISNENGYYQFLLHLYCVYRKIEEKMKRANYPIIPDGESSQQSFVNICIDLGRAKEEYKLMERIDFLKMYPVLKKLFFCYMDYIRYSVEHGSDMDEGNHLPGTIDEMKSWLQKLNTWFPLEVNKRWLNCMDSFIVFSSGYEQIIELLRGTIKHSSSMIFEVEAGKEPYIGDEHDKYMLFGFVDMKDARPSKISEKSTIFQLECPQECNKKLRRWICSTCGHFVKTQLNSTGQQFLFCSCGSKGYREKFLTCYNRHQQKEQDNKQNQETINHSSVSDTNGEQTSISDNNNDTLSKICEQIQRNPTTVILDLDIINTIASLSVHDKET